MKLNFKKLKITKGNIALLAITTLGLFLRFYQLEKKTGFDADQEEIAYKALELLKGDPVLLGPATSVAKFSIGPFFTYLWTIFSFLLSGDPVSGAYISVLLGVATIIGFYFLGKILFDQKTGIFLSTIYAVSFNFIIWDQNPWAPSLFYISEIILLLGAYISLKNPKGFILFALGFALGFQSHFGIFILAIATTIFWSTIRPNLTNKRIIVKSLFIVLLGFLPVIAFDLKNGFVNLQRFFNIFSTESQGAADYGKVLVSLAYQNISNIFPFPTKAFSIIAFWAVLLISTLLLFRKKDSRQYLGLVCIFISLAVFLFWRGNFSEYYLLMATPAFLLILGNLFFIYGKRLAKVKFLLFIIFAFYNLKAWVNYKKPLNLMAKKQAVEFIIEKGGQEKFGVSLTTGQGLNFGYRYIFGYYGVNPDTPPVKGEKRIFTIVVPPGFEGVNAKVEFDGIGVLWEGI